MKIRQPHHVQPTYANFTVIDAKRDEIVLNLCFAQGDTRQPAAVLVHQVVMTPQNFAALLEAGQRSLQRHDRPVGDA